MSAGSIATSQVIAVGPLTTLREAVAEPTFVAGLVWGMTSLVIVVPGTLIWRRFRGGGPPPLAGIALALATFLAVWTHRRPVAELALALAALLVGGVLARVMRLGRYPAAVLAVPGALLLSRSVISDADVAWVRPLVAAATVTGGFLLAEFDRRWSGMGLGPPLLAVTAAGIYGAVPDTEEALALLGASLPLILLGWPLPFASLGIGGAYAVAGVVTWTAATGGIGRPAAIVGGIACLGLMAAEPIARVVLRRPTMLGSISARRTLFLAAFGLHLGLVYVASRLAGIRSSVAVATVIAVGGLAAGVAILIRGGERETAGRHGHERRGRRIGRTLP